MARFSTPIERLISQFTKLNGVGPKTAQRYVFNILNMSVEEVEGFARALLEAKKNVKICSNCGNLSDSDPCKICQTRDNKVICVVREAKDVVAIEKISEFKGVYHVLGGVIDPMNGVGVDDIRLPQLFKRLDGEVDEVILALDTTAEGEATSTYISRMVKTFDVKVTRLAQGISIGSEIQYTDEVTLSKAFQNRKEV